jgi:hypothetical protein
VFSLMFGVGDYGGGDYLTPCKAYNYRHITNCRV